MGDCNSNHHPTKAPLAGGRKKKYRTMKKTKSRHNKGRRNTRSRRTRRTTTRTKSRRR